MEGGESGPAAAVTGSSNRSDPGGRRPSGILRSCRRGSGLGRSGLARKSGKCAARGSEACPRLTSFRAEAYALDTRQSVTFRTARIQGIAEEDRNARLWMSRCKVHDPVKYKNTPMGTLRHHHQVQRAPVSPEAGAAGQVMEGTQEFHRFVVLEFPSLEEAVASHARRRQLSDGSAQAEFGVAIVEGGYTRLGMASEGRGNGEQSDALQSGVWVRIALFLKSTTADG